MWYKLNGIPINFKPDSIKVNILHCTNIFTNNVLI